MDENSRYCNNRTIKYSEIGMPCPSAHYCLGDCMQNYWLSPSSSNCYCTRPEFDKTFLLETETNSLVKAIQMWKQAMVNLYKVLQVWQQTEGYFAKVSQVWKQTEGYLVKVPQVWKQGEGCLVKSLFEKKQTERPLQMTFRQKKQPEMVFDKTHSEKNQTETDSDKCIVEKKRSKMDFDKPVLEKIYSEKDFDLTKWHKNRFEALRRVLKTWKQAERTLTNCFSMANPGGRRRQVLLLLAVESRSFMDRSTIQKRTPVVKVAAVYLFNHRN